MIQFKRGKSATWAAQKKPLADGQPGYDKDRKKIKIGDGKSSWSDLPYASGLFADEILDSETEARIKVKAKAALNPLAKLAAELTGKDDRPIITYGTESPDSDTVGQLYLQYYNADPEVDYVVSAAKTPGGWSYQRWNSGIAKCFITFEHSTTMQTELGGGSLYQNSTKIDRLNYPITFTEAPSEIASVQSPGGLVWLAAAKSKNTKTQTAAYNIIGVDRQDTRATYKISLQVEGLWK